MEQIVSKQLDKVTRSEHYQTILSLWEQHHHELLPKQLFDTHVQHLDPSIDYHAFWYWTRKYENQKRQRISALTNQALEQGIDTEIDRSKAQNQIRDYATKLFSQKVRDFIEHPEKLDKMTFREALRLYEVIRSEEDRQRMVEVKERDSVLNVQQHELMLWEWFKQVMGKSIYDRNLKDEDVDTMAQNEWDTVTAKHGIPYLSNPMVESTLESR